MKKPLYILSIGILIPIFIFCFILGFIGRGAVAGLVTGFKFLALMREGEVISAAEQLFADRMEDVLNEND